jgi:hypothetical protein
VAGRGMGEALGEDARVTRPFAKGSRAIVPVRLKWLFVIHLHSVRAICTGRSASSKQPLPVLRRSLSAPDLGRALMVGMEPVGCSSAPPDCTGE